MLLCPLEVISASILRSHLCLQGALASGRRIGLLGLACIVSTIVVVDGPLLQRSSTVVTVPSHTSIAIKIGIAPEMPQEWAGEWITAEELGQPQLHTSHAWNATIPTTSGVARNNILGTTGLGLGSRTGECNDFQKPLDNKAKH